MNSQHITHLEQIYMKLGVQKNDCLFPARRLAVRPASAPTLALTISCPYLLHFDVVYSLHSIFYLRLIRPSVHFKAVRTFHVRKVHSLLRNQGSNYNIVVVHIYTRQFNSPGLQSGQTKTHPW